MGRSGYQVVNVFDAIDRVSNETGCRRTVRTVVVRTAVQRCWYLWPRWLWQEWPRRPVAGETRRPVVGGTEERPRRPVVGETPVQVCCTRGL